MPAYDELVLVARATTVRSDGALIRRFIQALAARDRGRAQRDPQAAIDALLKAAPDLKRGFAAASVRATLPVLFPGAPSRPFGWQDPARGRATSTGW